ncbi:MAG: hypothetical protein HZC05_02650, partial [Candidatus Magasanikbacteria bacterium]|nr:hypothetical protein [Candidatus Magasanikbacteria bacterium]
MYRKLSFWFWTSALLAVWVGIVYVIIIACVGNCSEKGRLERKAKSEADKIVASYGYTVVEDVAPTLKSVSDLELVSFLEPGEPFVTGSVIRQRAVTLKANLGLVDAKYLLDHQSEIPTEFRSNLLVFAGTLLRDSYGRLPLAYLCWPGGRWRLDF